MTILPRPLDDRPAVFATYAVELTKQQKLACGVLVVAFAGLAVDRFILSGSVLGPSAATAADAPPPLAAEGAPGGVAGVVPPQALEMPGTEGTLADRFAAAGRDRLASWGDFPASDRDAFIAPGDWFPLATPPAPDVLPLPEPETVPVPAHRLTSILTGKVPIAVVDGIHLRAGERVAVKDRAYREIMLVAAHPGSEGGGGGVTLEVDGRLVEVEMAVRVRPEGE